jgi:hypothetical protein
MTRKIIRILIHPLFIYLIISLLECKPYISHINKTIYNEMPKIGDNFATLNEQMVYYYNGNGKYLYSSSECYFELGNPSWATSYKEGGIKTISVTIANRIPLLGDMCNKSKNIPKKENPKSIDKYFSFTYLIDNFSNLSHVLFYVLLSFSTIFNLYMNRNKYWIALLACFIGGGLLEIIQQYFIVGRTASWDDQMLNSIGAIIGIALFYISDRLKFIVKVHNIIQKKPDYF